MSGSLFWDTVYNYVLHYTLRSVTMTSLLSVNKFMTWDWSEDLFYKGG